MHPEYGTMIECNGWLSEIDGRVPKLDVVEYKETFRVKGKPVDSLVYTRTRSHCTCCDKEMATCHLTDGMCDTCYRLNEKTVEQEMKEIRHALKWGDSPMRTNFNMEGF